MKLRATKTWTTRCGKQRVIRLYMSWKNLKARVRGTGRAGNGANYWVGKGVGWTTYEEFREWALRNGYSKQRCSLDRRKVHLGYASDNCRWVTVSQNTSYQHMCAAGDPENYPDVPF